MDCKMCCLGISAFSAVFLLYLFLIVAIGSETLYIEIHNRATSAVALFISALVYGGIFWYLYYDIFVNIDRKEDLKRWMEERKNQTQLQEYDRRSRFSKINQENRKA